MLGIPVTGPEVRAVGRRYLGSAKEKVLSKARTVEAHLMNEAKRRKLTAHRRTLTLAEFSKRFLDWVKMARLEPESRKYYESGWRMLSQTPSSLCALRTSRPTRPNRALRTLKGEGDWQGGAEWGDVTAAPRIELFKEEGRSALINDESEAKLLAVAKQPLRDVLTIMLDCGMRPGEVFQMSWEDISTGTAT